MICNTVNCRTGKPGPVQNGDGGTVPEAGPSHTSSAPPAQLDWNAYYHQEDREPFDVVKEMKGAVLRRDLDPDHLLELHVQLFVCDIKTYSQNYNSQRDELFVLHKRAMPPGAAAHCKSRLERSGGISTLLTWHYYLLLYFAERGDWLKRALGLMLESAAKASRDSRASSYIISAHNLNRWFNCHEDKAVLDSALRFVGERDHNSLTHWCVHIVADLERDPAARDKMRDKMIRAAGGLDHQDAVHCLEAAIHVAADNGPAREACMRLYEGHADGLDNTPLMMRGYADASRHADSTEDRMRLADKVVRAAGSVEFTEYKHAFEAPAFDLPGDTGPERVRHLVGLLDELITAAGTAEPDCDANERDRRDDFYRTSIGSDGLPGPSRPGPRGAEDAARGDRFAQYIQILAAFLSATALPYESDGRIAPRDHMDVIRPAGLPGGPTEALIEAGIERHHAGDYVSSVHTLLPQVEQALRLVLVKNGVPVAGAAGAAAAPKYDPMKTVIRRGTGVLGTGLSAFLLALLTDMDSVNLRNRVCHGLHSPSACPEGSSLPHDFGHTTSLLLILVIELVCGRPGRVTSPGGGGRG